FARGNRAGAEELLRVIEAQTSAGGFIPEQVWDDKDIPERELFNGRPSGSAMPLMWAHAEYIKLLRSLRDGVVFDLPPQTVQRYLVRKSASCVQSGVLATSAGRFRRDTNSESSFWNQLRWCGRQTTGRRRTNNRPHIPLSGSILSILPPI